ncbi:MAG: hypothetical protein QG650_1041 [Patescibacteria group bacterium]|nr:hypothetical protein [Patescibacteria group bacterium]
MSGGHGHDSHGGGHAPKASSNHGGGGIKLGAGPGLLALCLVVATSVVAIIGG